MSNRVVDLDFSIAPLVGFGIGTAFSGKYGACAYTVAVVVILILVSKRVYDHG